MSAEKDHALSAIFVVYFVSALIRILNFAVPLLGYWIESGLLKTGSGRMQKIITYIRVYKLLCIC
jgi:hypothetical protein